MAARSSGGWTSPFAEACAGGGVIPVGALVLGLALPAERMYVVPFAMAGALVVLAVLLMSAWRTNSRAWRPWFAVGRRS